MVAIPWRFKSSYPHHVAADGISFAATFLQKSLLTHSVAAPLRIEPAIAGLRFGFFILKTNAVSHSLRRSSFAQKVTLGSPARLQAPSRRLAAATNLLRVRGFKSIRQKHVGAKSALRLLSNYDPLRWARSWFSCYNSGYLFCQRFPEKTPA